MYGRCLINLEVNMNGFGTSCGTGRLFQLRLVKESLKHLCSSSMSTEANTVISKLEEQRFWSLVKDSDQNTNTSV